METTFAIGQYVVYGKVGVCQVADRREEAFGGSREEYLFLHPQSDPKSTLYVPCGNETLMARLRPLMTRSEIDALLGGVEEAPMEWIDDRNERNSQFRRVLAEGDRRQILRLIRCLGRKKQERVENGKKLSTSDEALLQECVRLVDEEFSLALGIPRTEVRRYIQERL